MRGRLSRRRPVALIACTVAAGMALAGCAPTASAPTPMPSSPSATAFFASDEEALAAATAAYDAYAAVGNLIGREGGIDPERLIPYMSAEAYESEAEGFLYLKQNGFRLGGDPEYDSVTLQSVDLTTGETVLYLCLDVSRARVIDSSGTDVTPPDRQDRQPLEVSLISTDTGLVIQRSDIWSGDNFC